MIQSDKIIRRTRASMNAARDRALFFWSFLVFHPEVTHKSGTPSEVYGVLARDQAHCPLCSMFRRMQGDVETCAGCPLMKNGIKCFEVGGLFARWHEMHDDVGVTEAEKVVVKAIRRGRARDILESIQTWDVYASEEE